MIYLKEDCKQLQKVLSNGYWLGKNEHLSVEIFKQIIANYDRIRV